MAKDLITQTAEEKVKEIFTDNLLIDKEIISEKGKIALATSRIKTLEASKVTNLEDVAEFKKLKIDTDAIEVAISVEPIKII